MVGKISTIVTIIIALIGAITGIFGTYRTYVLSEIEIEKSGLTTQKGLRDAQISNYKERIQIMKDNGRQLDADALIDELIQKLEEYSEWINAQKKILSFSLDSNYDSQYGIAKKYIDAYNENPFITIDSTNTRALEKAYILTGDYQNAAYLQIQVDDSLRLYYPWNNLDLMNAHKAEATNPNGTINFNKYMELLRRDMDNETQIGPS